MGFFLPDPHFSQYSGTAKKHRDKPLTNKMYMGDYMHLEKPDIDKMLHIQYNENGKSFEELLAEGIRQVNLKTIQKQIITDATQEKRSDCE